MNLFYDWTMQREHLYIFVEKRMKSYYHVSSHGLEKSDIFKSTEDFIVGMNDIAICVLGFDVAILCFCLMSNHFHFFLYGTLEECRRFSEEYKRRCAMRMRATGEVQGLREVEIQIDRIDEQDYMENVIAYILRNSIAAGIFMMPYCYQWSSISVYFNGGHTSVGEKLNDMSERKRFRILKSRVSVPDTYMVDGKGMILPSCYVDSNFVERLFRHPARLMAAISRKIEKDVEIRLGIADTVAMTDQEILTQMSDLIRNEYSKESMSQLTMEQRMDLCLLLKRNFRANAKQIARLTHLDPKVVSQVV